MRFPILLSVSLLLVLGCSEPPTPVAPVPEGVSIPSGMPNDVWFHENVLTSEVPVLVDFTATWCGPCRSMKPYIHEVEKAYGSRLKVVEVDVDEHEYLSAHFEVTGIPRLMLIKGGKIEADEEGGRSYNEIVSLVKPTLGEP